MRFTSVRLCEHVIVDASRTSIQSIDIRGLYSCMILACTSRNRPVRFKSRGENVFSASRRQNANSREACSIKNTIYMLPDTICTAARNVRCVQGRPFIFGITCLLGTTDQKNPQTGVRDKMTKAFCTYCAAKAFMSLAHEVAFGRTHPTCTKTSQQYKTAQVDHAWVVMEQLEDVTCRARSQAMLPLWRFLVGNTLCTATGHPHCLQ